MDRIVVWFGDVLMFATLILRLHYVPGGPGSPVCSKRSVPWNFGYIFPRFHVLLGFLTLYYGIRNKPPVCHGGGKVRYGYPRSITIISTFYYGLLRSVAVSCVLTEAKHIFRSVKVRYRRNIDTMQFKAVFVSFT